MVGSENEAWIGAGAIKPYIPRRFQQHNSPGNLPNPPDKLDLYCAKSLFGGFHYSPSTLKEHASSNSRARNIGWLHVDVSV